MKGDKPRGDFQGIFKGFPRFLGGGGVWIVPPFAPESPVTSERAPTPQTDEKLPHDWYLIATTRGTRVDQGRLEKAGKSVSKKKGKKQSGKSGQKKAEKGGKKKKGKNTKGKKKDVGQKKRPAMYKEEQVIFFFK